MRSVEVEVTAYADVHIDDILSSMDNAEKKDLIEQLQGELAEKKDTKEVRKKIVSGSFEQEYIKMMIEEIIPHLTLKEADKIVRKYTKRS